MKAYVLIENHKILTRGYILFLGAVVGSLGVYLSNPFACGLSAFLFGAFVSPYLPIWKDVGTRNDEQFYNTIKSGPAKMLKFYYWLAPIACILLVVLMTLEIFGVVV